MNSGAKLQIFHRPPRNIDAGAKFFGGAWSDSAKAGNQDAAVAEPDFHRSAWRALFVRVLQNLNFSRIFRNSASILLRLLLRVERALVLCQRPPRFGDARLENLP
jgi:hypothetical protein